MHLVSVVNVLCDMNKRLLVLLFIFVGNFFVFSQHQGFVLDTENNPLSDVGVFLVDQNLLLSTNTNGVFILDENFPNNSYLEFYKNGYESQVVQYSYGNELKVILQKMHVELDEIGIQENVSVLGNYKFLNIEKKSLNDNFTSSNSLVENVNQLGGVNSIGSGLGIQKIVIRGLSGLRVVTYLNGMRISNQEWANDHSIGFTDLGLSQVELIKGASSLKFRGDAVGGVLYFTDEPFINSNIPSGFIASKFDNSHFLLSNQFGFKWSKKSFYLNMHGEHTIASDYRLPDKTYLFNSRFRNKALKLSIGRFGDRMQNIFRYQYNTDDVGIPAHVHGGDLSNVSLESITLNNLILSEDFDMTRPTQFINNHLITFETKYFSDKIKYGFFAGYFTNNLQEYDKWTVPAFDMDLSTTNLRFDVEMPLGDININSGVHFQRQVNFNNITSRLIPDSHSNGLGIYSTIDYDTKNNFGFNGGVRLDYKEIICDDFNYRELFNSFNSSLGIFYTKNNHSTRFTYSGSFRSPHLSELFSNGLHHGTMRFEIGNTGLVLEKSHQLDFKYQWNNNHIGFVINPFLQYVNDFIAINPTDSFHLNNYRIYNYIQFNQVQISGFELNLHYHPHLIHNLHIEQSYAFINTENMDNENHLAFTPANKIKTRFLMDLETYNLPLGLRQISLYHLYAFAQDNVALYELPSNSYNVINMELMVRPLNNMQLVLSCRNILNETYVPHLSRIKEVAGGVPEPGRSFAISMKYNF